MIVVWYLNFVNISASKVYVWLGFYFAKRILFTVKA